MGFLKDNADECWQMLVVLFCVVMLGLFCFNEGQRLGQVEGYSAAMTVANINLMMDNNELREYYESE